MEIREACGYAELNRDNDLSCTDSKPCNLCEIVELDAEVTYEY